MVGHQARGVGLDVDTPTLAHQGRHLTEPVGQEDGRSARAVSLLDAGAGMGLTEQPLDPGPHLDVAPPLLGRGARGGDQ